MKQSDNPLGAAAKCSACGSADVTRGTLQSTGAVHFRPTSAKFFSLHTAEVKIRAQMCGTCGAITLVGDKQRLHAVQHPKATATTGPNARS